MSGIRFLGGAIRRRLAEQASSAMTRFSQLVHLDVVDSTNRYAVEAARAGALEGLVVVAEEQSDGRGRLGRTWVAPRGEAMLVSILFRPTLGVRDLHLIPTIVALAALDAIESTSGSSVALKWPNDLVAGDRKLGGVLAEAVEGAAGSRALVVGAGVNLSVSESFARLVADSADPEAAPVTGVAELAEHTVDRDALLASLLDGVEVRYGALEKSADRTMAEYRERCVTIGREVRAITATGEQRGRAVGIGEDGSLEVESDGSVLRIQAADVVHLRDV